jgi:NADH:ubiquinone oxidoreductase subunit 5 (subunit L)/multisubunit Na+/H+ antiporter MnhA subunit
LFGINEPGLLNSWLEPVFHGATEQLGHAEAEFQWLGVDGALIGASVAAAVIGVVAAWRYFGVEIGPLRRYADVKGARALAARMPFLYRASLNKWWFDELYDLLFIRIGGGVAAALWWFDREIVDGTVNAIGSVTRGAGRGLSHVQTGRVQNYALGIAFGLIVMAGSYLLLAGQA